MRVVITEDTFEVEGAPPIEIEGAGAEICETLSFIQSFAWAMNRLAEEAGMLAAKTDAAQAIDVAKKL